MITQQEVEITIKVLLEIDTDQVEYGVHGGHEDPYEIVTKAVEYYAENVELINEEISISKGIKVIRQNVQSYQ